MGDAAVAVTLGWKDVSYDVPIKGGAARRVLYDSTGLVVPGQVLAILGSSGSGKTTLLDLLAGRQDPECKLSGSVCLNGHPITPKLVRNNVAYVMQDDRLLPNLTVRETLHYAAMLRLPARLSESDREKRVSSVIQELGLTHVVNSRIGGVHHRGISGGERRRVTIGVQLLMDPKVLLLDEPTSGLDSTTAAKVVGLMSTLAKSRHRSVVMTIHQPSSAIFEQLDLVLLLSQGRTVYFGPAFRFHLCTFVPSVQANRLVDYFTGLGHPCPAYVNPLDHYMDLCSADHRSEQAQQESFARLTQLSEQFHASPVLDQLKRSFDELAKAAYDQQQPVGVLQRSLTQRLHVSSGLPNSPRIHLAVSSQDEIGAEGLTWDEFTARKRVPWHRAVRILLARSWDNLKRDRDALPMRLFQLFFFGVLLFVFINRLGNDQISVQNRSGFLYQTTSPVMFIGMLTNIALFPQLRNVYYREAKDGLYGPGTFLLSYTLHHLPFTLFGAILFASWGYWMIGLNPEVQRFLVYTAACCLLHVMGETLGVMCLSIFYDPNMANSVAALTLSLLFLISSGFLRSPDFMPSIVKWLGYASPYKYISNILVVNEFSGLTFECPPIGPCATPTGEAFIDQYYRDAMGNELRDWLLTAAFLLVFFLVAYLILKFRKRSMR